jgi:hypothetical protein
MTIHRTQPPSWDVHDPQGHRWLRIRNRCSCGWSQGETGRRNHRHHLDEVARLQGADR